MPLVRIDLRKGKNAAYRQDIGRVVYEAMVAAGVPEKDHFQVIAEHPADDFLYDPGYLGIHRTEDLVIIQITWNEGRSVNRSRRSTRPSPMGWRSRPGSGREDVFINLVEVKKENWSFGNGVAQYAA